jgi:hypothetical protein
MSRAREELVDLLLSWRVVPFGVVLLAILDVLFESSIGDVPRHLPGYLVVTLALWPILWVRWYRRYGGPLWQQLAVTGVALLWGVAVSTLFFGFVF